MNNHSCIILAGGKSRRMGGEDKGLKIFQGQELILYSIQLAQKFCKQVSISTNKQEYGRFSLPLIPDLHPEKGPMSGIYSGLKSSTTDWNLIIPCDTPFLEIELILKLQTKLEANQIIVPQLSNGRIQPLIGFYHKDVIPLLEEHLIHDRLKMIGLLDKAKTCYLNLPERMKTNFTNLNTLEDLKNNE
jgi:molybdopterin-guanine dinucleotide biosynthesis protein A